MRSRLKNLISSFSFSRELDTTEIIKWITTVVGAVIVFYFVTLRLSDIETTRINLETSQSIRDEQLSRVEAAKRTKEAVQEISLYRPRLKIHYTNMLSEDKKNLTIRVYLKNISQAEVYVFPPKLKIVSKQDNPISNEKYTVDNINSFHGTISPSAIFNIEYTININQIDIVNLKRVLFEYKVEIDDLVSFPIVKYLDTFEDKEHRDHFNKIKVKYFKYDQNIFSYGENNIWNDFWENPR